jgi:hypothetical protein
MRRLSDPTRVMASIVLVVAGASLHAAVRRHRVGS